MKDECKEVLENENSCKLTELFARISETVHVKETKVLTDQTDSDAAAETRPAAQNKAPRKSRRHSTLAQDIQLLTKSLRRWIRSLKAGLLSLSDSLQHDVQDILPHFAHLISFRLIPVAPV